MYLCRDLHRVYLPSIYRVGTYCTSLDGSCSRYFVNILVHHKSNDHNLKLCWIVKQINIIYNAVPNPSSNAAYSPSIL